MQDIVDIFQISTLLGVPVMAQWVGNLTSIHEDVSLIPDLTQQVKNPTLLWLWYRLAATALIRPLAWELPHATDAALKRKGKKKSYTSRTKILVLCSNIQKYNNCLKICIMHFAT